MYSEDRVPVQLFRVLRLGVAMEFIGHGALGLLHLAPTWTSYFAVVGIPRDIALVLMPIVGAVDIDGAGGALLSDAGCHAMDGPLGPLDGTPSPAGGRVRVGGCGKGGKLRRSARTFPAGWKRRRALLAAVRPLGPA